MSGVWDEFVVRPLDAIAAGLGALEDGLPVGQTVDAMVSRFVQGLDAPAAPPFPSDPAGAELTAEDLAIISTVERSLRSGLELLAWFERAHATRGFDDVFTLERSFNRPASSFGFFGHADLTGRPDLPVMGNVQRMFYDAARVPSDVQARAAEWIRRQIREFVLRYFMRISDFRAPETVAGGDRPRPRLPLLQGLSWCPDDSYEPRGFGFTQLFYKTRDGAIGKFREEEQTAIVDLRELGPTYDWIVVRVRIFDFDLRVRPFGEQGPGSWSA
jgi:hypothetical protein